MLKEAERYTRERLTQDWQAECNHWMDRAIRAETELRKCYRDIEELTAECTDQKQKLVGAGVRNAVLEKRLDRMLEEDITPDCPPCYADQPVGCSRECKSCWREWLEQEVQA